MNSLHISLHYFVCACVSNLTQGMIKKINQQFAAGEVFFFQNSLYIVIDILSGVSPFLASGQHWTADWSSN